MLRIPIGLGLIALLTASPAIAEIARIKTSSGAALVERGAVKLKPTPGLQLLPKDRLVTGKNGRMAVTFVPLKGNTFGD